MPVRAQAGARRSRAGARANQWLLVSTRIAAFCLLGALCASGQAGSGAGAAIRQVMAEQQAAWNRGDIPGFMQGYWRSPQTEFIGAGGITRGWQTVRDRYRARYPSRAAMGQLRYTNLRVTVLDAAAAYVTGNFALLRAHDHPHGVFTLLFRKFPEGWRIVSDHTTAAAP
ncbi:MAG TPA: AtzH-like domain-containing protein [Terriglobales bacterium]|nr:AtzH-like domain-containing protein [Terriglobales bacterium]